MAVAPFCGRSSACTRLWSSCAWPAPPATPPRCCQRRRRHSGGGSRRQAVAVAATAAAAVDDAARVRLRVQRARQLYEDVWTRGRITLLDAIMRPDHAQLDQVWQPEAAGGGRRRLKRGVLAYRAAYPDVRFEVQAVAPVTPTPAAAAPIKEGEEPQGDDDAAVAALAPPRVFVYWTASGTNLGPIRDQPPSGRRVAFAGVSLLEFDAADDTIARSLVFRQAPDDEARYFLAARLAALEEQQQAGS